MRGIRVVIGILLLISVALNFANVIGRYVFHHPIVGAEEVMVYLMVAIVFLGFGVVAWEGRHIRMDLILDLAPPRARRLIAACSELAAILVGGVVIWIAVPVIERLAAFNQLSEASGVPLAIPQAMIPLGMLLMILGTLARLIAK